MNWSKLFCGIGLVICLALRVFLIFTSVDPITGFYSGGGFAVSFYNTLLLLSLLIIVGYGLFVMKPGEFHVKIPALLTVSSAVCGLMILVISGIEFRTFLQELFYWGNPLLRLMNMKMAALVQLLRLFIGLSAGASLLSFAITGGKMFRRSGILIMPAIWTMVYTVEQFMAHPQIADMSDRMLWLLTLLFFSMTMIGQARIIRNVKPEKGAKYICAFGYACALCGLLLGLSQIITMQKVCTIDTLQWVLTTCMGFHGLVMALSCHSKTE